MNPKDFLVPSLSFVKKFKTLHFTKIYINKGFVYALLVSNFIFVELAENIFLEFISPFLAIYGIFKLVGTRREIWFWFGFFTGILWFYWISFSLIYFDLWFLIPAEILFIALFYGILFSLCGYFQNPFVRIIFLILIKFIHPFSFDWLNLELVLSHGIFEPNIRAFASICLAIAIYYFLQNLQKFTKFKILVLCFGLIFALQIEEKKAEFLPLKIKLQTTKISQNDIWEDSKIYTAIIANLKAIDEAIEAGYEMIIFPESAFALHLNKELNLSKILKEKSNEIKILLGSEAYENNKFYNSAYFFENGEMKRFDKHILVPFGEETPLPDFLTNFINDEILGGISDFATAPNFTQYKIGDFNVTNAICYEVTRAEIYKNSPKFITAISNNAWFLPSTQPILQRLIIRYYAQMHSTTVYHATNGSDSEIITPKNLWIKKFINLF